MQLNDDTVIHATDDHSSAKLDAVVVVLQLTNQQYYSLSGAASAIWEMIQQPLRLAELLAGLGERFEVEPDRCRAETLEILQQLAAEGLISVRPA